MSATAAAILERVSPPASIRNLPQFIEVLSDTHHPGTGPAAIVADPTPMLREALDALRIMHEQLSRCGQLRDPQASKGPSVARQETALPSSLHGTEPGGALVWPHQPTGHQARLVRQRRPTEPQCLCLPLRLGSANSNVFLRERDITLAALTVESDQDRAVMRESAADTEKVARLYYDLHSKMLEAGLSEDSSGSGHVRRNCRRAGGRGGDRSPGREQGIRAGGRAGVGGCRDGGLSGGTDSSETSASSPGGIAICPRPSPPFSTDIRPKGRRLAIDNRAWTGSRSSRSACHFKGQGDEAGRGSLRTAMTSASWRSAPTRNPTQRYSQRGRSEML